jgi:hypothetical protein
MDKSGRVIFAVVFRFRHSGPLMGFVSVLVIGLPILFGEYRQEQRKRKLARSDSFWNTQKTSNEYGSYLFS